MKITITIEVDSTRELEQVSEALGRAAAKVELNSGDLSAAAKVELNSGDLSAAANAHKASAPAAPVKKMEVAETPPPTPNGKLTLAEVRAAAAEKSKSGKKAEVKALIEKYGAATLPEVAEKDYADLLNDINAL